MLSERGLPDLRFEDNETGRTAYNDPRLHNDFDPETCRACTAQGIDAKPPCDSFQTTADAVTQFGRQRWAM